MKKIWLFLISASLTVMGGASMMSCSSDDDSPMSKEEIMNRIERGDFPKETKDTKDMPEWLVVKIAQFEEIHKRYPILVKIYTCSYRGQTIYLMWTTGSNGYDIFDANGNQLEWLGDGWWEETSTWKCIYVLE